ncbi:hypothetical protein RHGRI_013673 [Rhododendron griersonianum]|uniref:PetM of cytochrome b6/f complex subunit 7 n=1 Tax=Rhododendron griersonianum TaxID=479676 RepID=A0AAV6K6M0_9ERIC|nr:hypothetical protein RHGRI_013673 [Rhododendron griersonianum]
MNAAHTTMATASATLSPARFFAVAATSTVASSYTTQKRNTVVNSFHGLKAHNNVWNFGRSVSENQSFAKNFCSLEYPSQGRRSGGRGFPVCRNAAAEIFNIAAIINGLTLVGVAVGFLLLRIEAAVEESD